MLIRDLIEVVASKGNLSLTSAKEVVEAEIKMITETLARGEEVNLNNFGKFIRVITPAREGHNPRTMEKITISEKHNVKFRPSKVLKDSI